MRHLKELAFLNTSVSAGIAEVLAQLTGLTSLSMDSIEADAGWYLGACHNPVVLPSLKDLFLEGKGALQFLAGTCLPVLTDFSLRLQLCKDIKQSQLLQHTAGLLTHCRSIELQGQGKEASADDELLPILAALAPAWQHPLPEKRRDLYLKHLYCPRAVTQQLPTGMADLAFE
jgi:hypothetical protein